MTAPSQELLPLLAGPLWTSEGTEPACDLELGLHRSPEPLPAPREPGSRTTAPRSSSSVSLLPAQVAPAPQATGRRFPVPGSVHAAALRLRRRGHLRGSRLLWGQSSTCHHCRDTKAAVEERTCGSSFSGGGAFADPAVAVVSAQRCLTGKEPCLPNKDLTRKIRSQPLCEPQLEKGIFLSLPQTGLPRTLTGLLPTPSR